MSKLRFQETFLDGLVRLHNEIERLQGIERKQKSDIDELKEKKALAWYSRTISDDHATVIG